MAKKKTTRRRKKSTSARRSWWPVLFKVSFTLLVLLTLFLVYLDATIRAKFEGKRWALPAKVYARPLELYAGAPLSINNFKIELQGLGYQFVPTTKKPGEASFSATTAIIDTRGFVFSDGKEPSRQLKLTFNGSQINSLTNLQGKNISLVRLEPILIGGIYPLNNEDRTLIQLKQAPQSLINALISTEDRTFYQNYGISLRGMARALWVDIRHGAFVQGGSTLTQQLIKNFYLNDHRTIGRKLMEIPMAVLLELHYSKDEILQAYLNEVFLGQDGSRAIHGFGQAAHFFFAKPIEELTLPQTALLAGLVKGPTSYSPRNHPERALKRRNLVLKLMLDQGKISQHAYDGAIHTPLGVVKKNTLMKEAYPAFLDLVKRQVRENYQEKDLRTQGLHIFTSLNPIVQRQAEYALTSTLNALQKRYGKRGANLESSMVVTDPQTGEVLAIIGGRNTRYKGFNRALDSQRQIGSLVKAAVYLTALEKGYTLASELDDSPYALKMPNGHVWKPHNFENRSFGNVMLIKALAHSYNISTARLGMSLGLDNVINTLHRLGVKQKFKAYPSLLLGAQAMSPLEVATMYQTIAANGFQMPPKTIRSVATSKGITLSRNPFKLKQVVSPNDNYLIQRALSEVTHYGTARSIYNTLPSNINVVGKTGTSSNLRDSWFSGFAANRLAVVWVGRDDNKGLPFTGAGGALKIWTKFMASQPLQSLNPAMPADMTTAWVDPENGKLSAENCDGAEQLPFINGTTPTDISDNCASSDLDSGPVTQKAIPTKKPLDKKKSHHTLDWLTNWF